MVSLPLLTTRRRADMPRKKLEPVDPDVARSIGGLLRGLRKAAGYRAVKDVIGTPGVPAAAQTIYAYERGGLVPSLRQFLELAEFYVAGEAASPEARYMGVAAIHAALTSRAYHVPEAMTLIEKLQPPPSPGRKRRTDLAGRGKRTKKAT